MPAYRHAAPRLLSRSSGQSLVELAAVMPLLALVFVFALDFSRVFYYHMAVTSAAREGARYAAMRPDDVQGIRNRALGEPSDSIQLDPDQVTIATDHPTHPTTVRVTVAHLVGTFTPLASSVWSGTVSATVEMPVLAGSGP